MGSKNLNEKIMECISNPAKSRLMIEIMRRGKVTAKYLAEKCVDIPQTTLYRYLKRMTDDGLLKIVGETPIRGTVEKTYALTFDPSDPPSVLGQNSGAMYMQMFFQYFLTFAKIFQDYCDTPGIDIKKDRSGLSLSHVYLTDEELEKVAADMAQILYPLQENKPKPERKLRTVGLIISPEHKTGETGTDWKQSANEINITKRDDAIISYRLSEKSLLL